MQGSRRSIPTQIEPEIQTMLSSVRGELSLLPLAPVDATIPSWSYDFASSSSYKIEKFSQPFASSDVNFQPLVDLQEELQQQDVERLRNDVQKGGSDSISLGTDCSPNCSHLQLHTSGRDLQFQDVASWTGKLGWSDEDSSTTTLQPFSPHGDESGVSGSSKKLKLSESAGSPIETKAEMSPSQMKKLGGRITTLQQLVSPFGKTDTASVLLKAIEYIKFLQDQVQVLSSPYMASTANQPSSMPTAKQPSPMPTANQKIGGKLPAQSRPAQGGTDLRSRGLCVVPISCAPQSVNCNGADYWASGISRC